MIQKAGVFLDEATDVANDEQFRFVFGLLMAYNMRNSLLFMNVDLV